MKQGPLSETPSGLFTRVNRAKSFLLNPNYDVAEISSELGFTSVKQFEWAFTKVTGKPLRAYRVPLPAAWIR